MDLLQSFLSDAPTGVYGKWLGTGVREADFQEWCPFSSSSLTFRSSYPLWLETQQPRSTWVGDKACLAPHLHSGLFLKCCQDRPVQGKVPRLPFLFLLLTGMSHNDRRPGKAPVVSQHHLLSATPSGLPSWATQSLPRVEEQHSPGWEVPPGFGPRWVSWSWHYLMRNEET